MALSVTSLSDELSVLKDVYGSNNSLDLGLENKSTPSPGF